MQILLEEFYQTDLIVEKFHFRKRSIDEKPYQICGVTQSGKTTLIKQYLLELKKSSYLYINCRDIRIDIDLLNKHLGQFCNQNKIDTLVLDNYDVNIDIVNVQQLIITTQKELDIEYLETMQLYPLDYEEFLAYEQKYDATALNHFVQLGGFASLHKINVDERNIFLQEKLQFALDSIEFDILTLAAKFMSQKISAFTLYERLKQKRKISKDKLYASFEGLVKKNYMHQLGKYNKPRATQKLYLCDTSLKSALSTEKNFAKLFENMVFLELLKSSTECYYDDNLDFYLPKRNAIILCKPFVDERRLFKKLEILEAFLFTHSITKVTVITMNKEGNITHPLSQVNILPFDIWALGD